MAWEGILSLEALAPGWKERKERKPKTSSATPNSRDLQLRTLDFSAHDSIYLLKTGETSRSCLDQLTSKHNVSSGGVNYLQESCANRDTL